MKIPILKRTRLTNLKVDEVSLVDKAANTKTFAIKKADGTDIEVRSERDGVEKATVTPTSEQIMRAIGKAYSDDENGTYGYCRELIDGNTAIVSKWDDGGIAYLRVPYSIDGMNVALDIEKAQEVALAWTPVKTVKKSVASDSPAETGLIASVMKHAGTPNPPRGIGAADIPSPENTVNPEDITKAVETALSPIADRIAKLEGEKTDAETVAKANDAAAATALAVSKAVEAGITPLTERLAQIEKVAGVTRQAGAGEDTATATATAVKKSEWGGAFA